MDTSTGTRRTAGRGLCAGTAFKGDSASIAAARAFAADFLARVAVAGGVAVTPALVGDVQLVVSELVTNAVKYAPGPCAIELSVEGRRLRVTAWDTEPALPEPCPPGPGRIGRHGLEIVAALCEEFAAEPDPVGKRVIALMALAATAPTAPTAPPVPPGPAAAPAGPVAAARSVLRGGDGGRTGARAAAGRENAMGR